jgi:hypothetical protein
MAGRERPKLSRSDVDEDTPLRLIPDGTVTALMLRRAIDKRALGAEKLRVGCSRPLGHSRVEAAMSVCPKGPRLCSGSSTN